MIKKLSARIPFFLLVVSLPLTLLAVRYQTYRRSQACVTPLTPPITSPITPSTSPHKNPDFNGDGWVDHEDIKQLLSQWGNSSLPLNEDLNSDGKVNMNDAGILLLYWTAPF